MSVTKFICRSVMLVVILGASARGDVILTLGLFTSPSEPGTAAPASTSTGQGGNLASTDSTNQVTPTPTPTPVVTNYSPSSFQTTASTTPAYDAFVNFGTGPYANADGLTTGNALPWYDSAKITGLFGGQPSAQQVSSFDATVLQRVEQAFALSGVPVRLTDNASDQAAHMLSVVSNAVNPSMTGAIGMTYVGGNGFHFIDNAAPYANSVDQLESIVAHNVAHELMLAFGVPEVHDQTGQYIDSTIGQMSMFLNPNATFSAGAAHDLLSRNFQAVNGVLYSNEAQLVGPTPAPEPTTLAAWGLVAAALLAARRAGSRRASA